MWIIDKPLLEISTNLMLNCSIICEVSLLNFNQCQVAVTSVSASCLVTLTANALDILLDILVAWWLYVRGLDYGLQKIWGSKHTVERNSHFSASQYNPKAALFAGDLNSKQTEVEANFTNDCYFLLYENLIIRFNSFL